MTEKKTDDVTIHHPKKSNKAIKESLKAKDIKENEAGVDETEEKKGKEVGGRKGPEPTRFGDWEKNGRCVDF